MKNVKVVLILGFLVFSISLRAQIKVAGRLGMNMSMMIVHNPTLSDANITYSTNPVPGFNIGLLTEVPLSNYFAVQPGIILTSKGGKYVFNDGEKDVIVPWYYEIPVNFLYKPYFNDLHKDRFILLAGIYYASRFSGFGKFTSDNGKIGFDTSFSDMQKTDYGMNLGTGFESRGVEYILQYQLGFKNIAPPNTYKIKAFTSSFSFTLVLLFN
ncbi:MAG: outer membrane beta-barrel protein [Bacteroidales bacterium]|nr:outer membrane beta-barrel protein [Bacteroidales bacterium]